MSTTERRLRDGLHDLAGPVEPQVDLALLVRDGERLKRTRRSRWSLTAAAGLVAAALVIVPRFAAAPIPAVPQPATTAPVAPPTTPPAPTYSPAALTVLTCEDAYTTSPEGSGPDEFTASGVKYFLSEHGSSSHPVEEAGFPLDRGGYYTKSPVYLKEGVTWAVVTVLEGDAALAWMTREARWYPQQVSLTAYEATTMRLESCDGSFTGFLGGLRSPKASECLTLGISSNLHPEVEKVRVGLGQEGCE